MDDNLKTAATGAGIAGVAALARAARAPEHVVRGNLDRALSEARKRGDGEAERWLCKAIAKLDE